MSKKAKRNALDALRKSITEFRRKVELAKPSEFLPKGRKERRKRFAINLGNLADDGARRLASESLIDRLLEHHANTKDSFRQLYLGTFCWDAGVVDLRPPYTADLRAMKLKVYKTVRKLGMDGVGFIEIAPLRRSKHRPECLLIHIHVICWAKPGFKPIKTAKELSKKNRFPNSFGAPSVDFRSRKMAAARFRDKGSAMYAHLFSDLQEDQTENSLAWLGYYLWKAPAYVLQVCPRKERDDRCVLRSSSSSYSSQLALALERLLNEIPIADAMFGIGHGKAICSSTRTEIRRALKTPPRTTARRRGRLGKRR
jgi:hypothetical protein